jgi:hypothetical protein
MKSLLLAIMLVASVANAQLVPGNGDGHGPKKGGKHGGHNGGGPLVPGNGNGHGPGSGNNGGNPYEPGPQYPNNPYEPGYPTYPGYNVYGPARTYSWLDMGTTKVDKAINQTIRFRVNSRLVNEVLLRSTQNDTQIIRAYARLSDGSTTNITTGLVRQGYDARVRLHSQYSVRVESIEIVATSQGLFGSRARLQVWLGLAD